MIDATVNNHCSLLDPLPFHNLCFPNASHQYICLPNLRKDMKHLSMQKSWKASIICPPTTMKIFVLYCPLVLMQPLCSCIEHTCNTCRYKTQAIMSSCLSYSLWKPACWLEMSRSCSYLCCKVSSFGVTGSDSGVVPKQEVMHRSANDLTPPNHHRTFPCNRNTWTKQTQSHDYSWN